MSLVKSHVSFMSFYLGLSGNSCWWNRKRERERERYERKKSNFLRCYTNIIVYLIESIGSYCYNIYIAYNNNTAIAT